MRALQLVLLIVSTVSVPGCRQPGSPQQVAGESRRERPDVEPENRERRAIGVTTPQQLYDVYNRSRSAAEANYDGQFVKVVGPLVGVRRDGAGTVLQLGLGPTYAPGASIDARFDGEDEEPLRDLKLDQVVSVIGSPRYDAANGVVLLRCLIAPPEAP
jgi:hypothetical protein